MAWDNQKSGHQQSAQENTAYIDKATKEAMTGNPYIADAAQKLLAEAEKIGKDIADSGLSTVSKTRDGKEYTNKFVVRVEPAVKWNRETEQAEPIVHKDGTPVYAPRIEYKHGNTILSIYAREDMSQGVQLTAMNAKIRNNETQKTEFAKAEDIAGSNAYKSMKAVAQHISEGGYIKPREPVHEQSELSSFAVEANRYFSANSDKIPNKEGKLVNDVYAQYKNGEYGERVFLRNHSDNVVVELGRTKDGSNFARAINFGMKDENGRPATVFLNKPEDIREYIADKATQDVVAQYKGFDGKEQAKSESKKSRPAERD